MIVFEDVKPGDVIWEASYGGAQAFTVESKTQKQLQGKGWSRSRVNIGDAAQFFHKESEALSAIIKTEKHRFDYAEKQLKNADAALVECLRREST